MREEIKDLPLITIFTLCYNTGKYVIEAIESVVANNYPNSQHIIIDDFSTDGESVELIENWIKKNDYKCEFIKHKKNWGICKSLNQVISLAKGKYIAGICDDLWTSNRLNKEIEILEGDPEIGFVFGNAYIIDKDSKLTNNMYGDGDYLNKISSENNYLAELEKGNYVIPTACLYRTSVLKELGGFDENLSFEDWDMFLRIAKSRYKIKYVGHAVIKYRQYSTSFWHSRSPKLLKSLIRIYDKHNLFIKSNSFLSYLAHFKNIKIIDKFKIAGMLLYKGRFKLFFIVLLSFIYSPMRIQSFFYRKIFLS